MCTDNLTPDELLHLQVTRAHFALLTPPVPHFRPSLLLHIVCEKKIKAFVHTKVAEITSTRVATKSTAIYRCARFLVDLGGINTGKGMENIESRGTAVKSIGRGRMSVARLNYAALNEKRCILHFRNCTRPPPSPLHPSTTTTHTPLPIHPQHHPLVVSLPRSGEAGTGPSVDSFPMRRVWEMPLTRRRLAD